MEVRDAVEEDAPRMADLSGAPAEVMRSVVHDRTVRVAVGPGADAGGASDTGAEETGDGADRQGLRGFLSYDVVDGVVHVTQFGGDREALETLLDDPVGFAGREGLAVEALVTDEDDAMREALEARAFEPAGEGPRFEGRRTTRYRLP